jgi:hypothetical protein
LYNELGPVSVTSIGATRSYRWSYFFPCSDAWFVGEGVEGFKFWATIPLWG